MMLAFLMILLAGNGKQISFYLQPFLLMNVVIFKFYACKCLEIKFMWRWYLCRRSAKNENTDLRPLLKYVDKNPQVEAVMARVQPAGFFQNETNATNFRQTGFYPFGGFKESAQNWKIPVQFFSNENSVWLRLLTIFAPACFRNYS